MNKDRLKKLVSAYFLLILFPCIFGIVHYFSILKTELKHEINNIKFQLYERATNFMIETTPTEYFESYFQEVADKIIPKLETISSKQNSSKTIAEISKEIEDLSKNLGENIRCAIFDKSAELLNPKDFKVNEKRLFEYLWKDINKLDNIDYPERESDQVEILGRQFNYENFSSHYDDCMPTFGSSKTGVIYFKQGKDNNSGVLIYTEIQSSNLDIIQSIIKKYSTFEQPIVIYDSNKKQRITPITDHNDISFEKTNSDGFLEGFIDNDVFWLGIKFDTYKLMVGQFIGGQIQSLKRDVNIAVIIFFIIIISASLLFYKSVKKVEKTFFSIRYKLVIIFILAVYMPVFSLWSLSYSSLESHRIAIENRVKKSMVDTLNKIDLDYKKCEENILAQFSELDQYLKSFQGQKPPTSEEIEHKIDEILSDKTRFSNIFNWLDIRHMNQSQIYTTAKKIRNQRIKKMGRVLSILCLEKCCPEKLEQAGIKVNHSDKQIEELLKNPIVGFSSIFERPNQLNYLCFESSEAYWWWNYYPEKDNQIAFCTGIVSEDSAIKSYYKSIINKEYKIEDTALKIINFKYDTQRFFPDVTSNRRELIDFINVSNINKTIESAKLILNNRKYLCLCVPGSNLRNCFNLCFYPMSEIDYQIDKVRSVIYIVIILLLFIAVLTGSLLAKIFIIPLKEINRGLEALSNRQTDITLKIDSKDELGQLGQAFNQMTAEIKDMLLAGAVQNCIIPSGEHQLDGYDCIVYNQMAADVGGDYADFFELPEDKLLIVIGDVTGHGISSSLLTAMVKAAVFRFASKNLSLNEIAVKTSNMIFELLKHKKLMTFCAISLDKKTGEMAICNAGHPYPIIKSKEAGIIRTPSKTGLPLGVSKKRCQYTTEQEVLNPEETLFIYTDGFPEAENDKGEAYGYDNFQQLIAKASITSSAELKNILTETFKQHYGDKELADDVTFIILRRKALQNE